jgi:hypothetical protein
MSRAYSILVHFERDDESVTHSTMSGSELIGIIADSKEHVEEQMKVKLVEMEAHSYDIV